MLKSLRHLIQQVNAAQDFQESLNIMVRGVKAALETQVCSIFLFNRHYQEFVLAATDGLNPEAVKHVRIPLHYGLVGFVADREEPLTIDDSIHHSHYLPIPLLQENELHGYLGVPIIYRGNNLGVFAVQHANVRSYEDAEEALLVTMSAQLATVIAKAEISGELDAFFGLATTANNTLLTGIPGVLGIAVGRAVVVYPLADFDAVPILEADNIDQEIMVFEAAAQAVRDELQVLAKRLSPSLPKEEHELFDAYMRMLDPASLCDEVIDTIKQGLAAQSSLKKVVKRYMGRFEAMDNAYMRERANDVLDLGQRVLFYLQSAERKTLEYPAKTILVGEAISATDLAEVPPDRLVGVVSGSGSRSSHVALLANALGIPTVMGTTKLSISQLDDQELVVDGYYGQVYIAPSPEIKRAFQRLADEESQRDKALEALHHQPARTLDGHRIELLVNTGLESDISLALSAGAEGIGLYRTEVQFLQRDRFPSSEEQRVIYRQLLGAFSPRSVTMRTLDIGGDKELSYFPIQEDNPFLGWRGVRISLDHPDIFLMQLRAMLRASEGFNNLQVMFPMVTDLAELKELLALLDKAYHAVKEEGYDIRRPPVGIMIEVPSAVYQAYDMAKCVDFLSVGSNDLTQYVLAVDRNNSHVANLYHWLHPAVLAALLHVVRSGHRAQKTVSICGEMAADPLAVVLLLGMGFDSLSMNANSLLRVKWIVRQFKFSKAKKILDHVMLMTDTQEIRAFLETEMQKVGLGGLIRAGR